jgi:hypothetical protein
LGKYKAGLAGQVIGFLGVASDIANAPDGEQLSVAGNSAADALVGAAVGTGGAAIGAGIGGLFTFGLAAPLGAFLGSVGAVMIYDAIKWVCTLRSRTRSSIRYDEPGFDDNASLFFLLEGGDWESWTKSKWIRLTLKLGS